MTNINDVFKEMNDGEEWVDVECDGCSAVLGGCLESEYPNKELVLCSYCDYTCCSYTTLEQVNPVKYAVEIAKQKKAIKDCCTPHEEKEAKCAKFKDIQSCTDCTDDPCPVGDAIPF